MSKTLCPPRRVKQNSAFSVVLERVLGFTTVNNCSLALDTRSSTLFYVAGCVVVGESCETNIQFIVQSPSRKSLTCVDVSQDGKYITTGESGHQPMVRVWSRTDGHQLGALGSHHFRISSIRFSPTIATHIVSVGCQEDQTICVWDRAQLQKVASAKVSARVNAVAFSDDGSLFVTVGIRHVRFWYIDLKKRPKVKETQPLKGRNAVLGDMLHNTFTDVCCCSLEPVGAGGEAQILTLVLSQAGQLLQINAARCIAKWVDLKVTRASCLTLSKQIVGVGCASGVCLLFSAANLRFVARVPLPHPLGASVSGSKFGPTTLAASLAGYREGTRYAEIAAVKLDLVAGHLLCMYTDHSLYCWNVTDLKSISRRFAHFYHSRAICGCAVTSLVTSSSLDETDLGRWAPVNTNGTSALHVEHLVTCSDDDTVRIWSFPVNRSTLKSQELFLGGREESSILYTDTDYVNLCSEQRGSDGFGPTYFGRGSTLNLSAPGSPSLSRQLPGWYSSNANIASAQNGVGFGLRSISISPDAGHLAVGDRSGQLRIYDFNTFKLLHSIRAHDAEILSITFFESKQVPEMSLLCTSSRDRVIHVFAPKQDYSRVQTLADHSGVVNSALFFESEENHQIYLISCGADRSLLFRVLSQTDPESQTAKFVIDNHISVSHSYACATIVGPSVLAPSEFGPWGAVRPRVRRYLAVACQDRQLRLYQITKARQLLHYRASTSEDGSPVCCAADPTGTLIATAGSDKQVNLFHLFTGELVATLYGHADIVTNLVFLPDLRHIISVSYDSCLFVWRLAPELTALMLDRQQRITTALAASPPPDLPTLEASPFSDLPLQNANDCIPNLREDVKFGLNETDLPSWARENQHSESDTKASDLYSSSSRKGEHSLTGSLNSPDVSVAAGIVTHVSRSQRERLGLSLASKRQRNRTIGAAPTDLSRGNSLCRLPNSGSTSRNAGEDHSAEEITSMPSMSSSTVFPRWATSVVDITQVSPFEPPLPHSTYANKNLINPSPLPLTSSLSSEALSAFEDLPYKNQNFSSNGLMSRSQIEEYCPKLSRVEEVCDAELVIRKRECKTKEMMPVQAKSLQHRTSSVRANWSEPDAGTTSSSSLYAPLGANPVQNASSNPISSSSDSASTLSLLLNVRNALDAALAHLATSNAQNKAIIEGREFFCSCLEWRVVQLRTLLHAEPFASHSPRSSSSSKACIFSDAAAKRIEQTPSSQASVVELIERLLPSIRSAMTETLAGVSKGADTSGEQTAGTLKIAADFILTD